MRKIIVLSLIHFSIFSNRILAQQQDSWLTFNITRDALCQINSIYESKDRTLWFGSSGSGVIKNDDGIWTTYTMNDGLLSNYINSICESSDGAMWFGTMEGLVKLQAGNWITFTQEDGLIDNDINAVCESKDGSLWIGTKKGVSRFLDGNWTQITTTDGLIDNKIFTIHSANDGAVWFGTFSGISIYKNGTWDTIESFHEIIWSICEANDGALWFGTNGMGVYRYDGGELTHFYLEDGLAHGQVYSICSGHNNDIWAGTLHGLSRYNNECWTTYTTDDGLSYNEVRAIGKGSDGGMWFGTAIGNVSRYEETAWRIYKQADGLVDDHVISIYESNDAAIWFGTPNGVSRFYNGHWDTFTTSNGLSNNYINTIFESSDRTLWFGTDSGATQYNGENWISFTKTDGLTHNKIEEIYESTDGAIWFGTPKWISKYHHGSWQTIIPPDTNDYNNIYQIYEDSEGKFWICADKAVYTYSNGSWSTIINEQNGSTGSFCLTQNNELWIGTLGGAIRYKDGEQVAFNTDDGLCDNFVFDIYESVDGALWFGTARGVSRYFNGLWTTFTVADGLGNNWINKIFESQDEMLWFGSAGWDGGGGVTAVKPDLSAPFTYIDDGPQNNEIIGIPTPLFTFHGSDYRTKQENLFYSSAISNILVTPQSQYWSPFFTTTSVQTQALENGFYTFHVRAKDSWGNIDPTPATRTFTIDITQPTTVIESPRRNDVVSQKFAIIGSVFDDSPIKDFDYFSIFYGKGSEPGAVNTWTPLVENNKTEIRSDTLAIWNTTGLRGAYQLKLFARDTLAHEREDIITVNIVDVIQEIKTRQGGYIADVLNRIQVYFPPNGLADNTEIQIVRMSDVNLENVSELQFKYAGLTYQISPQNLISKKPGTLSISYSDSILANGIDEKKLSILRFDENGNNWQLIGGTVDNEANTVTTTLNRLGQYGLFESLITEATSSLSEVNCQPRVFSPKGGGYDTKTAISFYLGKPTDVTVKAYNLSGRLKKCLVENEQMNAGMNVVDWDGRDENGNVVVSGLYIITIEGDGKYAKKTVSVLNR